MKLENFEINKQETEVVQQDEKFKRYCLVDSLEIQPGHTAYQLDLKTGEIEKVKVNVKVALNVKSKREMLTMESMYDFDKLYVSALNEKNAQRKFEKMLGEIRSKALFIRSNPLIDITKNSCWPKLKKLGFIDFAGDSLVAISIMETVKIVNGKSATPKNEQISICSIFPKLLSDDDIWYFFEMIGGYAKIRAKSLTEEMCLGYTLEAYKRFNDIIQKGDIFTKPYKKEFTEKYKQFRKTYDVNFTEGPIKEPRTPRGRKSDANREVQGN